MTTTTFNTDLAERVMAQIKDHPETWEQGYWATKTDCGTAHCVAGWACTLSGQQIEMRTSGLGNYTAEGHVSDVARRLLGLTPLRGHALFDGENDLDTIERLVKHYANNPDDDSLPS